MNKLILVLFISIFSANLWAQKVYWSSPSGKINEPIGGVKNVKDIIKKEFVYPTSALKKGVEGAIDIKYKLDKSGFATITGVSGVDNDAIIYEAKRLFLKIRFTRSSHRNANVPEDLLQINFSKKAWVKLYNKRKYQAIEYPFLPVDSTQKLYQYPYLKNKPKPIFNKKDNYSSFNNYVANKLEYPETALRMGLKGQVVISFVIEQSGQVTNIEIIEPLAAGCTEEALRLIKNMTWFPAIENEKAVRTLMVSSIGFGVASSSYKAAFNQGK